MIGVKQIVYLDFIAGTNIREAIEYSLDYAAKNNVIVNFRFNGVNLHIIHFENSSIDSQINDYLAIYDRNITKGNSIDVRVSLADIFSDYLWVILIMINIAAILAIWFK